MSQKISFKRIAAAAGMSDDDSDDDRRGHLKKKKKKQRVEPPVSSNPLPVADRLQLMVARARKGMYLSFS
jgi:hypothetical protein